MLLEKLIDDLDTVYKDTVEFHLIDKDGNTEKLEICITDGHYLYPKKNKEGKDMNVIIVGLRRENS